jgi:MFS family permease
MCTHALAQPSSGILFAPRACRTETREHPMEPGHATRNRTIIYAANFIRSMATAMVGVLMAVYLGKIGFSESLIGIAVGAGLAGGALAALIATLRADAIGRRRFLIAFAALSAAGGFVVALASNEWIVAAAAFFGMLNGMGKDRGAALAVEQAILPATVSDERRTSAFAHYSVLQSVGAALGALLAALPDLLRQTSGMSQVGGMRAAMIVYALLMLATAILYLFLSAEVEVSDGHLQRRVSPESQRVIARLSALFVLDSIGGGFLTQALISYFFVAHFGVGVAVVGSLYFGASIANAISQLIAPILARRIGLINTMVFTHLPSSLFLVGVAMAPNFTVAAVLFLMRECLVQMDVPARGSYVMAVVKPEERTFASGVTGLVRLGGWAIAPTFAGFFMQGVSLATPLYLGPAFKVTYDLLLYRAFRHLKPPEEQRESAAARTS